jgi:thiol-disulfide isomerase/thioredoxin
MLAFSQEQYVIRGIIPDKYNDDYVYMARLDIDVQIDALPIFTDSIMVKNGEFIFNGILEKNISLYLISLGRTSGSFIALDTTELKADYVEREGMGYFKVSGTVLNEQLTKFVELPMDLSQKITDTMMEREKLIAKNEWTQEQETEISSILVDETNRYLDFSSKIVKENIHNAVGEYVLVLLGGNIKKEIMKEIEPNLRDEVKEALRRSKAQMEEKMKNSYALDSILKNVKEGNVYIDFEGETFFKDKIKLSSIIKSNKLVLLDFWASWCAPCIKEMSAIISLYKDYKEKGLEIIGVSIDIDRTAWRNMIKNKKMDWIQIIDSDISNPIKDIYGVKAIPYTVLINEKGVIVANRLRGDELRNIIETFLNSK